MIVFSLFFHRLGADTPSNIPYSLFVLAGILPWTFFANSVSTSGQSVVGSQALVTKVYFPRLLIPAGATGACLVDLAGASLLLAAYFLYPSVVSGVMLLGWGLLLLPVFLGLLVVAALGVGTLLAALTVAYRDFRHVVPFMVQLWLFATPSIYMPAEALLNARWRAFLPLNPAYGL